MERACRRSSRTRRRSGRTGGTRAAVASRSTAFRTAALAPTAVLRVATIAPFVNLDESPSATNRDTGELGHYRVRDDGRDFDGGMPLADVDAADLRLGDPAFVRDRSDEVTGTHAVHLTDVYEHARHGWNGRRRNRVRPGAVELEHAEQRRGDFDP